MNNVIIYRTLSLYLDHICLVIENKNHSRFASNKYKLKYLAIFFYYSFISFKIILQVSS